MSTPRGKWSLDKDALQRLLERLDADPATAASRYEEIQRRLIQVLAWRGSADPETHADESLDRVARKIQAGMVIDDVARYACGVARFVLRESERKRGRPSCTPAGRNRSGIEGPRPRTPRPRGASAPQSRSAAASGQPGRSRTGQRACGVSGRRKRLRPRQVAGHAPARFHRDYSPLIAGGPGTARPACESA